MKPNSLQQIVAENLRHWRKLRNLSVGDLASRAELAKGTLSQLERGLTNPTLDTLWALAEALNVPFGTLITRDAEEDPASQVFGVADRMSRTVLLDRNVGDFGIVESYRMTLSPHSKRQARPHGHGVFEVVVGIKGACGVGPIGSPKYVLPGDVVTFFADGRHSYESGVAGCDIMVLVFYPGEQESGSQSPDSLSWPAAWSLSQAHLARNIFQGIVPVTLSEEIWRANDLSVTHRTFLTQMSDSAFYRFYIIPLGRIMTDSEEAVRKKLSGHMEGEGRIINRTDDGKALLRDGHPATWKWLYLEDVVWSRDLFHRAIQRLTPEGKIIVVTHLIDPYFDTEGYQRSRLLYVYSLEMHQWPEHRVIPCGHPIQRTLENYLHIWSGKNVKCANAFPATGLPVEEAWVDAATLMHWAADEGLRMAEHYRVAGTWSSSEWSSGRHVILFVRG